jgi:hypothetical protein
VSLRDGIDTKRCRFAGSGRIWQNGQLDRRSTLYPAVIHPQSFHRVCTPRFW